MKIEIKNVSYFKDQTIIETKKFYDFWSFQNEIIYINHKPYKLEQLIDSYECADGMYKRLVAKYKSNDNIIHCDFYEIVSYKNEIKYVYIFSLEEKQ